jgi:hypothetical protein
MKDLTKEKKKAKEQAKDPNKPKKPLSSYLIFRFSFNHNSSIWVMEL